MNNTEIVETNKAMTDNETNFHNGISIWDLEGLVWEGDNTLQCDNLCTNNRFGHAYHFKKYAGISENKILNCTIEHGMNIVHDAVCSNEVSQRCKTIITFSQYRKEIIERHTDLIAEVVGPYIAYSEDYYSEEEIKKIKGKLGKTLLVFPQHNAEVIVADYDKGTFIKRIETIAKSFDSVLVCLFYKDITQKNIDLYKSIGAEIVSSGCANNIFFLPRQRAIINLADAVLANGFSTAIAYSLYFNKPVLLLEQEISLKCMNLLNAGSLEVHNKYLIELQNLCSDISFGNLEKQKEWGNYMFGLDRVKQRDEMNNILSTIIR